MKTDMLYKHNHLYVFLKGGACCIQSGTKLVLSDRCNSYFLDSSSCKVNLRETFDFAFDYCSLSYLRCLDCSCNAGKECGHLHPDILDLVESSGPYILDMRSEILMIMLEVYPHNLYHYLTYV
jgi:hypothetical protein